MNATAAKRRPVAREKTPTTNCTNPPITQALAITAWRADLSTSRAFTTLKSNVLEANAARAMGPGSILADRSSGAVRVVMVLLLSIVGAAPVRPADRLAGMIVKARTVAAAHRTVNRLSRRAIALDRRGEPPSTFQQWLGSSRSSR